MTTAAYLPTAQQLAVIDHEGSAFVRACPGAGKTRTMVERARRLLSSPKDRRGVAFLSFTNAAVDELEARLRAFGVLPTPLFPSFIGTFDRFLWQFLISPFGVPGCDQTPRLIPDKSEWVVTPSFAGAQPLPLKCFDRTTGRIDPVRAMKEGFDITVRSFRTHEACALAIIEAARTSGRLDFDDVRGCVRERLTDPSFARIVGAALVGRFREIVVDEAQDCNPADLAIVEWLRRSGLPVKVICDPSQAIYEFRGGVTDELLQYADGFHDDDRLSLSGNFRSSPGICAAISKLRPPVTGSTDDSTVGRYRTDTTPIHILSYPGTKVTSSIGTAFRRLVEDLGLRLADAPVLAATHASAGNAIGQPTVSVGENKTLLLAEAVMGYHFAFGLGKLRDALVNLHKVVLVVRGHISTLGGYHSYLTTKGLDDGRWRPEIIAIANELRLRVGEAPSAWLIRARAALNGNLVGTSTISQRLRDTSSLAGALATLPLDSPPARSIHSVKGLEFPAVCVVMTTATAGKILEHLEGAAGSTAAEAAREIYVAASRAERLLAIAVPRSQAARLKQLLESGRTPVQVSQL